MDAFTLIFGTLAGLFLLAFIAFPERFVPDRPTKTKRVGASYWGYYEGEEVTEDGEQTIEVKCVKKKDRVIGGGTTYAQGRGISFRGS